VDIPFVFRHNDQFYMLYTGYDGKGYQSALAASDDLLHWTPKGVILGRDLESDRWDRVGAAATWMIKESDNLYDIPRLRKVDGKYWLVYHSYPMSGYEEGPAEIGMAWCEDEELMEWHRMDAPVYSWKDGEEWERGGLYKACIISHNDTWYMFYNAKNTDKRWIEQTGLATSKDLIHWTRCEKNPVLRITPEAWDGRFLSDPYIVKDKDHWVNFYFGYNYNHAQEGLAISHNLEDWEKVEEPILTHGKEGELDAGHAHKASVLYYEGTLYHFYCATRPYREGDRTKIWNEFRTIAVAASKPFKK
jgi:predicted GH43/DUF377 family glycosyl hydrolase